MRHTKGAGTVVLWALQILVSLGFILTGIAKFRGPFWVAAFSRWGYPDGFRLLIGVLEVASGLLLAFPRTASYAAALLCCILAGATGTLLLHKEPAFAPIGWFVAVAFIGIARRRRAWRPVSRSAPATLNSI